MPEGPYMKKSEVLPWTDLNQGIKVYKIMKPYIQNPKKFKELSKCKRKNEDVQERKKKC
jgi:hypothetical protein|tara:strand:- start:573 stop:749 length:177 start_codon:yes stop_codon:yes gene_type:complete